MGDYVTHQQSGIKRIEKMGDRTCQWTKEMIDGLAAEAENGRQIDAEGASERMDQPAIFAPILPIPLEQQLLYVEDLGEEFLDRLSGLAIHDSMLVPELPQPLRHLPRLSLDEDTHTPHDILRHIRLGIDILTIPFLNAATDAGIAFEFSFPVPTTTTTTTDPSPNRTAPLGKDMWLPQHATDLSPLLPNCKCYTCTRHHSAYVHHLLTTKEMLGWILLQLHNLHVLDAFFAGIRTSMSTTTTADGVFFLTQLHRFADFYHTEFPESTGQGPRVRGYQFKSVGRGEPKKNAVAYKPLAPPPLPPSEE